MSKIKINVSNGDVIEKPLVTCFQGNSGNYVVLDNEKNGNAGFPIISISKFDGANLVKILDQNEWTSVKECLKTIISGKNLPYLNVPETLTAGEDFYTQLTLPVASFDLLKSVYAPIVPETPKEAPAAASEASTPAATPTPEMPPVPETPAMEGPATLGSIPTPAPMPEAAPVVPAMETPAMPASTPVAPAASELPPVPEIPAIPPIPGVGEIPAIPAATEAPVAPAMPEVATTPETTPAVPAMPEITPAVEPTPVEPAAPVVPEVPATEPVPMEMTMPVPEATEAPKEENTIDIAAPVIMTDPLPDDPLAMMVPDPNATEAPVVPVESAEPITMPTNEMVENTLVGESDDIAALKENFMKSCETMFDALIKKFENKKNE